MSGFTKYVDFDGKIRAKYEVPTRRLDGILKERGITHVDYVSLDVEGAELEVLNGIDFDQCDFTCFTIELGRKREAFEVRKFMIEHGYTFLVRLWVDDLWIKEGFVLPDYAKDIRKRKYEEYAKG